MFMCGSMVSLRCPSLADHPGPCQFSSFDGIAVVVVGSVGWWLACWLCGKLSSNPFLPRGGQSLDYLYQSRYRLLFLLWMKSLLELNSIDDKILLLLECCVFCYPSVRSVSVSVSMSSLSLKMSSKFFLAPPVLLDIL